MDPDDWDAFDDDERVCLVGDSGGVAVDVVVSVIGNAVAWVTLDPVAWAVSVSAEFVSFCEATVEDWDEDLGFSSSVVVLVTVASTCTGWDSVVVSVTVASTITCWDIDSVGVSVSATAFIVSVVALEISSSYACKKLQASKSSCTFAVEI